MTTLHDFHAETLGGEDRALADYAGKALLIVNVASKCGLTPHYTGLQKLWEEMRDDGVVVLGFPCNQFGKQEPGTAEEIEQFCTVNYGVTFPMFAKVEVNGEGRHPVWAHLTTQATEPDGPGDVAWNFAKFVVDPQGRVVARFSPKTAPDDDALLAALRAALGR